MVSDGMKPDYIGFNHFKNNSMFLIDRKRKKAPKASFQFMSFYSGVKRIIPKNLLFLFGDFLNS